MDWSCDFYIDYWPDVIEEEALNEKCCIQVLRKSIAKADNEIEELEGELLFLQTQLERAEKNTSEEWFDICCKELKEKIHSLESSIRSLKDEHVQNENENENENDNGVQPQTRREPAMKLHDIIKEASLRNDDFHVKQEPPAYATVEDLISDTLSHVSSQSDEKNLFRNIDSTTIKAEEVAEYDLTHNDHASRARISSYQCETTKVQEAGDTAVVNTHALDSSWTTLQSQKNANIVQLMHGEGQEPNPATDNALRLEPSVKLQGRGRKNIIQSDISNISGKKAKTKTNMKTPKTPKAPKNRTQSVPVVRKPGTQSLKPKVEQKHNQEQLASRNSNSTRIESWSSNGTKVFHTVFNDVPEPGAAFTHRVANLNSIFKSEEKANNHSSMQLDAVEVKEPSGVSFCTPNFVNLQSTTLAHLKNLAKSFGLKGIADKRKDQIITLIEEYMGRAL